MRLIFRVVGFAILAVGLFGCLFSIVAIYDPVGTGYANDAAPLVPAGAGGSWRILISSVGVSLLGLWIFLSGKE
jgi:hypothetical protein